MCKLLLVANQGAVLAGLSFLIKDVIKDVDQHLAGSLSETKGMLNVNDYQMLVYSLPVHKPAPMHEFLDVLKSHPALAVLLLSEDTSHLPLRQLYSAGISGIVDKKVSVDEIQKMIEQVYMSQPRQVMVMDN